MTWINLDRYTAFPPSRTKLFLIRKQEATSFLQKLRPSRAEGCSADYVADRLREMIVSHRPELADCALWSFSFDIETHDYKAAVSHQSFPEVPDGASLPVEPLVKPAISDAGWDRLVLRAAESDRPHVQSIRLTILIERRNSRKPSKCFLHPETLKATQAEIKEHYAELSWARTDMIDGVKLCEDSRMALNSYVFDCPGCGKPWRSDTCECLPVKPLVKRDFLAEAVDRGTKFAWTDFPPEAETVPTSELNKELFRSAVQKPVEFSIGGVKLEPGKPYTDELTDKTYTFIKNESESPEYGKRLASLDYNEESINSDGSMKWAEVPESDQQHKKELYKVTTFKSAAKLKPSHSISFDENGEPQRKTLAVLHGPTGQPMRMEGSGELYAAIEKNHPDVLAHVAEQFSQPIKMYAPVCTCPIAYVTNYGCPKLRGETECAK